MFKHILVVIFLLTGVSCYSEQDFSSSKEKEFHRKHLAMVYTGIGNTNVLMGEYELAIEDFNRASHLLAKSEKPAPEIDFWISFGKAVSYDHLWNREECERAIGTLILSIYELGEEDSEEESFINLIQDRNKAECLEMLECMHQMASLSLSLDVRSVLLSFIEAIAEEISESFQNPDFDDPYEL